MGYKLVYELFTSTLTSRLKVSIICMIDLLDTLDCILCIKFEESFIILFYLISL